MSEGVVALWIAGAAGRRARRGAGRRARLPGGAAVNARFGRPRSVRLRGRIAPPADKSISHRAAIIGAMASEPVRVSNYLDAADTRSTLAGGPCARGDRRGPRRRAGHPRGAGCATPSRRRSADRRRQRRHADAAAARLAGLPATAQSFTLDGDESIRRRPVDRIAEPLRAMGATDRGPRRPLAAVHGPRRRRCAGSTTSCRWPAPRSSRACCWPGWPPSGRRCSSRWPSRDHTERMLLAAGAPVTRERDGRRAAIVTRVGNADELELERIAVPGDLSSAAFLIAAGVLVARLAAGARGRGGQLDADRAFCASLSGWARSWSASSSRAGAFGATEPVCDLDVTCGPIEATTVEADEVPLAIDELPLVALLGLLCRGGDGRARGRRAAGQGVRPDRHRGRRPARAGRRHRGLRRRLRRARHRRPARRADRRPRGPPPGDARRGGRPGLRGGRGGGRDGGRRRLLSGLRRGHRGLAG